MPSVAYVSFTGLGGVSYDIQGPTTRGRVLKGIQKKAKAGEGGFFGGMFGKAMSDAQTNIYI